MRVKRVKVLRVMVLRELPGCECLSEGVRVL